MGNRTSQSTGRSRVCYTAASDGSGDKVPSCAHALTLVREMVTTCDECEHVCAARCADVSGTRFVYFRLRGTLRGVRMFRLRAERPSASTGHGGGAAASRGPPLVRAFRCAQQSPKKVRFADGSKYEFALVPTVPPAPSVHPGAPPPPPPRDSLLRARCAVTAAPVARVPSLDDAVQRDWEIVWEYYTESVTTTGEEENENENENEKPGKKGRTGGGRFQGRWSWGARAGASSSALSTPAPAVHE